MRVLLVEDDGLIGDAIRSALPRHGVAVDWMRNGEELLPALTDNAFDILVLDIGLPGRNGFDLLQDVRKAKNAIPILILTARYELDERVKGLNLGADDYLVKPFAMEELIARCRALTRRGESARRVELLCHGYRIDPAGMTVEGPSGTISLTPKAFNLLQILVESQGRVVTRRFLEESLYGWDGDAESNTLEAFVSQIRRKLGANIIRTIRGVGYMVPKTESDAAH